MSIKINENKRREDFFSTLRKSLSNEVNGLISSKIESDSLLAAYKKLSKTYRPTINVKRPQTFSFFGSCQQYYRRASDYIINYYPFDGSREDLINYHQQASVIDLAVLKQIWPSSVGHLVVNYSEKVDFFAGPNKIAEAEYVGKSIHNETGLNIIPSNGNTVEFWMKKDNFNEATNPTETVVHIGTYPGKSPAEESGDIKIQLAPGSGASPFVVSYKSGNSQVQTLQVGDNLTDAKVADSSWHHYAFVFWVTGADLKVKMFIDGAPNSTTTTALGTTVDLIKFLGGSIGGEMNTASGDLSAAIDDFRFWKGRRSSREIARFFDKKIFASDMSEAEYTTRLGVYYRFNKPAIGVGAVDSFVIDHSGHEVFGRVKNYQESNRVLVSAITASEVSENTESPDPILDEKHPNIKELKQELDALGRSYDIDNPSMLEKFIPQWAREEIENSNSSNPSEFQILLHLMSTEFDDIKLILDSIVSDRVPDWQESNQIIDPEPTEGTTIEINYADNIFMGCDDESSSAELSNGFRGDRYQRQLIAAGFITESFFIQHSKAEQEVEGVLDFKKITKMNSSIINAVRQRLVNESNPLKRTKGTHGAFTRAYNSLGQNNTDITDMQLVPGEELFLKDEKVENCISQMTSVSFVDNNEGTLFMYSDASDERTNIPGSTEAVSEEYTAEGVYIFPSQEVYQFSNLTTSLFGARQVPSATNDLTIQNPDNANFTIKVEKQNLKSKKAKFILQSTALLQQDIETKFFADVYDNSRWNIYLRIRKSTAEPFLDIPEDQYEIVFSGYRYIQEHLIDSFEEVQTIDKQEYTDFKNANKTFFIGAERQDLTGTVMTYADSKVLGLSVWKAHLSDEEIKLRSQNPAINGNSFADMLER